MHPKASADKDSSGGRNPQQLTHEVATFQRKTHRFLKACTPQLHDENFRLQHIPGGIYGITWRNCTSGRTNPSPQKGYFGIKGLAQYNLKDYGNSYETFQKSLEYGCDELSGYWYLGLNKLMEEDYANATKHFKKAEKYGTLLPIQLVRLGVSYRLQKDYPNALKYYEKYFEEGKKGSSTWKFAEEGWHS